MKYYWILFVLVGVLIMIFPELMAYIFWSFLIFIWMNLFFISKMNSSTFKNTWFNEEESGFAKIWKYKIFK